MSQLPLAGLKILDCASFIAAPFAATTMAEFGAEVLKVEPPGVGDSMRRLGTPAVEGADSFFWLSEARNKRSITLDLRTPEGVGLFKRLVRGADVVCENFRPETMEKWGLGYDALKRENPGIILFQVSAFGQQGPYRDRPGFARIAHAFGGLCYLTGMPGGPPLTPGSTSLADYICGLYGAFAIMTALRHREATGEGQKIDIALYEPIFRVLDELAPAYQKFGVVRDRQGLHTAVACPHGHFECADGQWVALACSNDKMFARLAAAMDQPELAEPTRFGAVAERMKNHDKINELVAAWFHGLTRKEALARAVDHEVPCAPINSIRDLFEDQQIAARGTITEVARDDIGALAVPNVVPRLSQTPGAVTSLGPHLGEANDEIYGQRLGLSRAEQVVLRKKGVI